METETETRNDRDLIRVVKLGSAVAYGCLLAVIQGLTLQAGQYHFTFSVVTIIAFAVGAAVAWYFWSAFFSRHSAKRRRSIVLGIAALGLIGIVGFLSPLRFVPSERWPDIFIGLSLAAFVLSGIGFVLWKLKRFLDADSERNGGTNRN